MATKTKLGTVAKRGPGRPPGSLNKKTLAKLGLLEPKKPKGKSTRAQLIQQQREERAAKGLKPLISRSPSVRVGRSPQGRAWSTEEKMDKFIAGLRATHNIGKACELAGTERHYMYQLKAAHPDFKQRWVDAWEEGIDTLEAEAHKRALAGSDILLMFMLNGNRSQKYKDKRQQDVNVNMPTEFTISIKAANDPESEDRPQLEDGTVYDVPPDQIRHLPPDEKEFQED